MKYNDLVESVFGKNWIESREDRDGGYAIAAMYAYIDAGIEADANKLARHINVPVSEFLPVFRLMQINGLFSSRLDARNDKALLNEVSDPMTSVRAWCYIAGIGSNLCGMVATKQ